MQIYQIPNTFIILDLETTGLSCQNDQIIEIGVLFIKNRKPANQWHSLICPDFSLLSDETLSPQVESLTHITKKMLLPAPSFQTIARSLLDFLKEYPIAGHRVDFDISFLNAAFVKAGFSPLQNDYFDTLLLSQRLLPELIHHKLSDIASYYGISTTGAHRALRDCEITCYCLTAMEQTAQASFPSMKDFEHNWEFGSRHIVAENIFPQSTTFNTEHPLYGKNIAITGILFSLSRRGAMQKIADFGGINQNKVNTSTDYLILGKCDNSSKEKKALRLQAEGYPIQIISEEEFLKL